MTRTLIAVAFLLSTVFSANAQMTTPRPSPSAEVMQTVGLTDVSITYSRPAKKDRAIFGALVPFGDLWRTGANMASTIEFSTDVTIDGKTLEAGKYALYTKPGEKTWDVIFYSDWEIGGTPKEWEESKVALMTTVKVGKRATSLESFRISVENLTASSADLMLEWDMTMVKVPMMFPTEEIAMKSIEKTMNGPSANDYASAAAYYLEQKKDLEKAYEWINEALATQDKKPYWWLRRKSLIEAELGKKDMAIATAKESMAAAQEAGNMDYVRMNEKSIAEWSKK